MINEPVYEVARAMVDEGVLEAVDALQVDHFLARPGLSLLFFGGGNAVRRESHDVAVALRELLRDYTGALNAAWVEPDADGALQSRFRVAATPCLVLCAGDQIVEVVPRVRDWAEYSALFQRYLGPVKPRQVSGAA